MRRQGLLIDQKRVKSPDALFMRYHQLELLETDPLAEVHRWRSTLGFRAERMEGALELEAVAVISALLAYGNVKSIRASIRSALARMVGRFGSVEAAVRARGKGLSTLTTGDVGWVHRFTRLEHLEALLSFIGRRWESHGSLGATFLEGLEPEAPNFGGALNRLLAAPDAQIPFLMTRPADGSVCKRWCMLMRWMGRKDALDLGLWTVDSPLAPTFQGRALFARHLVIPMDTHVAAWARREKLLSRKTLHWKAALEVTDFLKTFDSMDPVKYDFSICREGMLKGAKVT